MAPTRVHACAAVVLLLCAAVSAALPFKDALMASWSSLPFILHVLGPLCWRYQVEILLAEGPRPEIPFLCWWFLSSILKAAETEEERRRASFGATMEMADVSTILELQLQQRGLHIPSGCEHMGGFAYAGPATELGRPY